ncbi:MAG: O-antigen ligase [Bacteroidetes bacterium]|nr:O-antigen ligase [Bacteroidota bacterium]
MNLIIVITYLTGLLLAYRVSNKNYISIEIISISSFGLIFLLPLLSPYTEQKWIQDESFKSIIWYSLLVSIVTLLYSKRFIIYRKNYQLRDRLVLPIFVIITVFISYNTLKLLVQSNFNIIALLIANRVAEYLENAKDFSDLALKIIAFINVVYVVLIIELYRKKRKVLAVLGYVNIVFYIIITTHTRFILLSYLVLPFLYYNSFIKKFKTYHFITVVLLAGLFLSFTNYVRTGISDQFNLTNPFEVVLKQVEIESVDDFYTVYSSIKQNQSDFDYGLQYFYYLPLTAIPRSIWTEKPIVSYFWRLTKDITKAWPGPNNFVLTSTIYGEGYHQGGIFGIFIIYFLYIVFARTYIGVTNHFHELKPFAWFFLIHIPMDLRGAFSSVIVTYIVGLIMISLLVKLLYHERSK